MSVWDEVDAIGASANAPQAHNQQRARPDWAPPGSLVEEEVVEYEGVSVRLKVDWGVGIGGATWTSGQQLCRHLAKYKARYAAQTSRPLRVLELGAGTGVAGLLASGALDGGVCLAQTSMGRLLGTPRSCSRSRRSS